MCCKCKKETVQILQIWQLLCQHAVSTTFPLKNLPTAIECFLCFRHLRPTSCNMVASFYVPFKLVFFKLVVLFHQNLLLLNQNCNAAAAWLFEALVSEYARKQKLIGGPKSVQGRVLQKSKRQPVGTEHPRSSLDLLAKNSDAKSRPTEIGLACRCR